MKDNINIISTGIINLIYKNNKKIIVYSPSIFNDICELLKEIYNININAFNNDIKNFDKEKNILINHILNIKDSKNNSSKEKNENIFYNEEELSSTKDNENKLSIIENDIFNSENNFDKNKNTKNNEKEGNSFQQINSTITSFQGSRNNLNTNLTNEYKYLSQLNNNHIPYNSKGLTKKSSMSDKLASNLIKNLTTKNIINNKHYLPKIKGQKMRKDSNCDNNINSNNNNNNIYIIKNNEQKNVIKEKDKIIAKNKSKLIPCPNNRTPSAKICQGNYPTPNNNISNNYGYDEICYKNNNKINYKSISNKNVNIFCKSNSKPKNTNLSKDNNNGKIHGNISNKICIIAEKTKETNIIFK